MNINLKEIMHTLCFPLIVIYFEIVLKISIFDEVMNMSILNIVLFSISSGLMACFLSSSFSEKTNKFNFIFILAVISFIYGAQLIYFKIFSTFFSMYSIIGASDAVQFMDVVKIVAVQNIVPLFLILLPLILALIFYRNIAMLKMFKRNAIKTLGAALLVQLSAVILVSNSNSGVLSDNYIYNESFIINLSAEKFGLLTTERLDFKNLLLNYISELRNAYASESKEILSNTDEEADDSSDELSIDDSSYDYGYNVINIDFDQLIQSETNKDIKSMHEYFNNVVPTKKNNYTGKFKGKNLILITAESFSPYAIDEKLTPTLYKMYEEGFKFNQFYTPLWGVSTTDGEYAICTGLIPKAGIWSFYRSSQNNMMLSMGNQLRNLNYSTFAYHNHYYDYYFRNKSHPNMGYSYKGLGNGLNVTETWPESDLEMIDITVDEFIHKQPFHTYYMTVSGHLQYTFSGNYMSYKNKKAVENLDYSESVKAYLASNIELDKAMEHLIKKLEDSGIADDTLIAVAPDHYPYGLKISELSELAGHEPESNFEIYKSVFLLWSKGIEPVTVEKPCSSLDILPTLSNLMGLEYDSRLLMGNDIFSDKEPLVLFQNRSWITDKAMFNSETEQMTALSDSKIDSEYQEEITDIVKDKFKYSALILDNDYYRYIFK